MYDDQETSLATAIGSDRDILGQTRSFTWNMIKQLDGIQSLNYKTHDI